MFGLGMSLMNLAGCFCQDHHVGMSMLGKEQREGLLSGMENSDADFIFVVSERYPTVPSAIWSDLAATMNAEYESMAASQSTKVAKIESLRKHLRRPQYMLAKSLGGFPTIDLDEHDKLILGSTARETGNLETVNPFGDDSAKAKEPVDAKDR